MKKKGPWTTLQSKQVYENPWIRVTHDEVKTPAGTEGIYGCVHFKNLAVAVLPIDNQGYTWLVKQYRYPLEGYTLELPEGGCPLGESPLKAAKRELQEETGLIAGQWTELLSVHLSNSVTDEFGYIYLAQELTPGAMALDETEDISVQRVSVTEAIDMIADGRITDHLSVTALLKYQLLCLQNG